VLLELLERCVVEYQPALGAVVRKAHRDDATRFNANDDALAENSNGNAPS